MDSYDIAYIVGGLILVAFEVKSLLRHDKQTITHHVWRWRNQKTWRRIAMGLGIVWLFYHFVIES